MKRINKKNLNTRKYWNDIYKKSPPVEGKDWLKNSIIANHIVDGTKVVELGCGLGWLLSRIKSVRPHCGVVGVEFSDEAINILKQDKRLTVKKADFRTEKIEGGGTFDYVISSEVLEHLEDPEKHIKEIARLLKRGGTAILTTPYRDHIPSSEHVWEFDIEDLKEMFSGLFSEYWVYPWASGGGVAVMATGELVYPAGHLDVIWTLGIK